MSYVETMRARRVLFWFTIIVAGILVLALWGILTAIHYAIAHGQVHPSPHTDTANLSKLLGSLILAPLLVATLLAPSLSAEGQTVPLLWTRPAPRESIAWQYTLVDVVAILIGYAIAIVAAFVGLVVVEAYGGKQIGEVMSPMVLDWPQAVGSAAIVLAVSLMVYSLIRIISARLPGKGGAIAGFTWIGMVVLLILSHYGLPDVLRDLVLAVNYLNPLVWVTTSPDAHLVLAPLPESDVTRALIAAVIAVAELVAATWLWATREA
jgi:hypothetical protein